MVAGSSIILTEVFPLGYNASVPVFRFYHPIEVRYGDLDPQAHVNNAKYLTYMEQARIAYLIALGLWDGRSFMDIGIILAEARVTFLAPVYFGQQVRVGVRVAEIRNKSLTMEYALEDAESEAQLAVGSSVLVAYDDRKNRTLPFPKPWRETIGAFEGLPGYLQSEKPGLNAAHSSGQ
jgi:acyl-CoA thioester hydrolase